MNVANLIDDIFAQVKKSLVGLPFGEMAAGKIIIPDGPAITRETKISGNVQSVEVFGQFDVVVEKEQTLNGEAQIHVIASENVQNIMALSSKNGVLRISLENNTSVKGPAPKVHVKVSAFNALTSFGNSTLEVHVGKFDDLHLGLTGNSTVKLRGNGDQFAVSIMGISLVDAGGLEVNRATVDVTGNSSIEGITVNQKLFTKLLGAATVAYKGTPQVVNATTQGEVRKI